MRTLKEYNTLYNLHKAFTAKVTDLITALLEEKKVKIHLIESRTKTQISFAEKIVSKNKNLDEFKEITDISGIRIITYYQKDVDIITDLITQEFEIDRENSIDKSKILKSNEFGYQSVHYIIKTKSERAKLTEWISFKDLKAEIQIRTVLQHSWASISHELQYKKSYEIPQILKRKLYRLAGLFELADEEFGELKIEHNKIENNVFTNDKTTNETNTELNIITIDHFIQKSDKAELILQSALKGGFSLPENVEREIKTKSYKKSLSDILKLCQDLNIDSLIQLEDILEGSLKYSDAYFSAIIKKANISVWTGWKDFFVELILFSKIDNLDEEYFISQGWDKSFFDLIKNISRKYYG
jgi:putative GTP pyrophosphokinase